METVIVERVFAEPIDLAELEQHMREEKGCFVSRRVRLLRSMVSRDRRRVVCIFEAPDAESVRIANQLAKAPFERVWTADVLEADALLAGGARSG